MIRVYFPEEKLNALAAQTAMATLESFGISEQDADMEIAAMQSEEIRKLNFEARGVDKVTDVLSFCNISVKLPFRKKDYPFDINPENGGIMLGEIYICLDKAQEQANEYCHSYEREFAFLVCHGVLHLLGLNHSSEAEEEHMKKQQEEILSALNILR